jgi:hypothetical protein
MVFEGEARIDPSSSPAHQVRAYVEKYKDGIAALEMSPEEFSSEYSAAIKITPSQVRGWE